jgi:hypothetical protein
MDSEQLLALQTIVSDALKKKMIKFKVGDRIKTTLKHWSRPAMYGFVLQLPFAPGGPYVINCDNSLVSRMMYDDEMELVNEP